jgi:hypothetical protein
MDHSDLSPVDGENTVKEEKLMMTDLVLCQEKAQNKVSDVIEDIIE